MSAEIRASGSIHVLVTPSFPSAPYPVTAPENVEDAFIAEMIKPMLARHINHPTRPPLWLLVMVYRNAWRHWRGPRRKRFAPSMRARQWALYDCEKCIVAWVGGRPDPQGAWRQHMHLADWTHQRILVSEAGETLGEVVDPEKAAAMKAFEERRALAEKAVLVTAATAAELPATLFPPTPPKRMRPPKVKPPGKIDGRSREAKEAKKAAHA